MNKKLIALAVAGVTLAPAVMAQTANPVTLYGRIYATYNSVNANGSGVPGGVATQPIGRRGSVADESSFIGVRGTEDLGGGLKAFFQIESSAPPDAGGGTFASRNSAVGLQGGFGSVLLGRWDSPFKVTALANDPSGQLTLGDPLAVISTGATGGSQFNRRQDNSFQYWTPNINGFTGRFMYSPNEGKTATANPTTLGLNVAYAGGPVVLGYAYEVHKDQVNTTATANVKEKGHEVIGTFKFGPFKVGATAQRFDRSNRTNQKVVLVTGQYDIGKHSIWGMYGKSKDGLASTVARQPEGKFATVGYYYNFTKRTFFVATYASVVNNFVSSFSLGGSGAKYATVSGPGNDPKGFGVGLRHLF